MRVTSPCTPEPFADAPTHTPEDAVSPAHAPAEMPCRLQPAAKRRRTTPTPIVPAPMHPEYETLPVGPVDLESLPDPLPQRHRPVPQRLAAALLEPPLPSQAPHATPAPTGAGLPDAQAFPLLPGVLLLLTPHDPVVLKIEACVRALAQRLQTPPAGMHNPLLDAREPWAIATLLMMAAKNCNPNPRPNSDWRHAYARLMTLRHVCDTGSNGPAPTISCNDIGVWEAHMLQLLNWDLRVTPGALQLAYLDAMLARVAPTSNFTRQTRFYDAAIGVETTLAHLLAPPTRKAEKRRPRRALARLRQTARLR